MNSIWELETFYRQRDIIIIGAGFTGLWTAISIKERHPEKSVLVIERNSIPLGTSTRNVGFACFGSLTEIIADSQKMGEIFITYYTLFITHNFIRIFAKK